MIRFEDYTMNAASMGKPNPMPDIKNISYIHAGYEIKSSRMKKSISARA